VASSFAALGHQVVGIDTNTRRIGELRRGECWLKEPGLEALLHSELASGRLSFLDEYPERLDAEFAFIAVGTPSSAGGASDLRALHEALNKVAPALPPNAVIVNKSTVPVGTGDLVTALVRAAGAPSLRVVSNPEFLQEGHAVRNFMEPDRIVLGSDDPEAVERTAALYDSLDAPIVRTDIRTAEMIKYASNTFLATKLSFVNEMATICDAVGADISDVSLGMGFDPRIGSKFLNAGIGWGGSCFPKDATALEHTAAMFGAHPQLLRDAIEINRDQRRTVLRKIRGYLGSVEGRRILVLGASFKPDTTDIRDSPALEVANLLHLSGAEVLVYDPEVPAEAILAEHPRLKVADDLIEGARDSDAIVLATEWAVFNDLPLSQLAQVVRTRFIVDGRNVLDPMRVRGAGFSYRCIGRPGVEGPPISSAPQREERALAREHASTAAGG